MKFSHQPIVAQAECLKSLNRECIYSSLRHVLDVCRDVLDEGTLSSVDSFIKDSNQKKYSSGFLFYIINEIGININSENIDNINLYFNLLGRNIMPNSKIIIGNQDNIDIDLFVLYENINDDVYNFTCIPVSEDKSHTLSEKIVNSLDYINVIDSDLYGEIITIVDEFFIFKASNLFGNEVVYSGSDFHKLGTVFINEETCDEDKYFIVEKIIHESAHQMLLSIMIHDEIVLNPDYEKYPSPLRTGLRTMNGIYHAAFVLYRISAFFYKIYHSDKSDSKALSYLKKNINQFDDCHSVIKTHGDLTVLGKEIIANCKNEIEGFKNELH